MNWLRCENETLIYAQKRIIIRFSFFPRLKQRKCVYVQRSARGCLEFGCIFFFHFINETYIYQILHAKTYSRQMQAIHTTKRIKIRYFHSNALYVFLYLVSWTNQPNGWWQQQYQMPIGILLCSVIHTIYLLLHSNTNQPIPTPTSTPTHHQTHAVRELNIVWADLHIRSSISVSAMQWSRRIDAHTLYTYVCRQCVFFLLLLNFELEWQGICTH